MNKTTSQVSSPANFVFTVAHKNGPKLSKDTICPYPTALPGALLAEGTRFDCHNDFQFLKCVIYRRCQLLRH